MIRSRALASAFVVLTLAAPAIAQEPRREPSAGDIATARTALNEGLSLRDKGEHVTALARMQTAFDLVPTPVTAFELGKTHMMLGHVLQAHELFKRVTRMEARMEESERAKMSRSEAARLAPQLEPRIPQLRIKLKLPKDATALVRIDDELVATTKGEETLRAVDPGEHRVVAKAGEGAEQMVTVHVAESETKDVELAPPWVPPKPKPKEGEQVYYTTRTNPLAFVGLATIGVGLTITASSLTFLSSAHAELADRCGENYCPPSTIEQERPTRDLFAALTVAGAAVIGAGVAAGIFGLLNPVKEKVITGSNVRFGPTSVEWRVTF